MGTLSEITAEQDRIYKEIVQEVKAILSHLPVGTEFNVKNVEKNNGEALKALVIQEPGKNISPTIYLDDFKNAIASGQMTVQEVARKISSSYHVYAVEKSIDVNELMKKENLFCEVINKDMNTEFLETVPHEEIADVAVIVRCRVSDDASFVVKNEALGHFGLTPSEAIEIAKKNTIAEGMTVKPMSEVLFDLIGEPVMSYDEAPMMYVISNQNQCFGATLPFISSEARQKIYDKLGCDYYLIPSSIHECLAIPASGGNAEEVKAIIGDVNATQVKAEEVLGTQPYLVDSSLKLRLACEQPKLSQMLEQSVKQSRGMHM